MMRALIMQRIANLSILKLLYEVVKLLLFVTALFLSGCDKQQKQIKIDSGKPAKVEILQNGQVHSVILQPIQGLPQHTDFIGTEDNPTMDGGIINAADGLAVNSFAVKPVLQHLNTEITAEKQTPAAANIKSFQDNWATSNKVKTLLKEAAKDGKLDYVLKKTDEKGLPASVATIPMIESAYQETAKSSKGAAGVWQLMPLTAMDYGVNKNERYNLKPSTDAALDLLNDLHKQFGSWELAFAAYNAGAKSVSKALQQNPRAKSVQELNLPKETKDYVSHVMALNKTLESL